MTSTKWLRLSCNRSCWHGYSDSFHIALKCIYAKMLDNVCVCTSHIAYTFSTCNPSNVAVAVTVVKNRWMQGNRSSSLSVKHFSTTVKIWIQQKCGFSELLLYCVQFLTLLLQLRLVVIFTRVVMDKKFKG